MDIGPVSSSPAEELVKSNIGMGSFYCDELLFFSYSRLMLLRYDKVASLFLGSLRTSVKKFLKAGRTALSSAPWLSVKSGGGLGAHEYEPSWSLFSIG